MKGFIHCALVAALAASEVTAHSHRHLHRHVKRDIVGSSIKPGEPNAILDDSFTVFRDTEGNLIDPQTARDCLEKKECKVVGSTEPSIPPSQPQPAPSSTAAHALDVGAKFMEQPVSDYSPPVPTTQLPPPPMSAPTQSAKPAEVSPEAPPVEPLPELEPASKPVEPQPSPKPVEPQPAPKPVETYPAPKPIEGQPEAPTGSITPGYDYAPDGKGLERDFPSGTIPCDQFPSDYGARPLPHLGHGGWSGIQEAEGHHPATDETIVQLRNSDRCSKGSYCSYACPDGYEKAQWPKAQGSKGQSVGGLWCNHKGFLELSRAGHTKLCQQGLRGVVVRNKLHKTVTFCRTDYPGTEKMAIPTIVKPGKEVQLTNPIQSLTYILPDGRKTSAQYYLNPAGLGLEDTCIWENGDGGLRNMTGNWAPLNLGTSFNGKNTFINIFPNKPTAQGVALDYSITIKAPSGKTDCHYRKGLLIEKMEQCNPICFEESDRIVVEIDY